MHVKDACCIELKFSTGQNYNDEALNNVSGHYRYHFPETRTHEIENGNFEYKRKLNPGYIFRNKDGFWSVSRVLLKIKN